MDLKKIMSGTITDAAHAAVQAIQGDPTPAMMAASLVMQGGAEMQAQPPQDQQEQEPEASPDAEGQETPEQTAGEEE